MTIVIIKCLFNHNLFLRNRSIDVIIKDTVNLAKK